MGVDENLYAFLGGERGREAQAEVHNKIAAILADAERDALQRRYVEQIGASVQSVGRLTASLKALAVYGLAPVTKMVGTLSGLLSRAVDSASRYLSAEKTGSGLADFIREALASTFKIGLPVTVLYLVARGLVAVSRAGIRLYHGFFELVTAATAAQASIQRLSFGLQGASAAAASATTSTVGAQGAAAAASKAGMAAKPWSFGKSFMIISAVELLSYGANRVASSDISSYVSTAANALLFSSLIANSLGLTLSGAVKKAATKLTSMLSLDGTVSSIASKLLSFAGRFAGITAAVTAIYAAVSGWTKAEDRYGVYATTWEHFKSSAISVIDVFSLGLINVVTDVQIHSKVVAQRARESAQKLSGLNKTMAGYLYSGMENYTQALNDSLGEASERLAELYDAELTNGKDLGGHRVLHSILTSIRALDEQRAWAVEAKFSAIQARPGAYTEAERQAEDAKYAAWRKGGTFDKGMPNVRAQLDFLTPQLQTRLPDPGSKADQAARHTDRVVAAVSLLGDKLVAVLDGTQSRAAAEARRKAEAQRAAEAQKNASDSVNQMMIHPPGMQFYWAPGR